MYKYFEVFGVKYLSITFTITTESIIPITCTTIPDYKTQFNLINLTSNVRDITICMRYYHLYDEHSTRGPAIWIDAALQMWTVIEI